MLFTLLVLFKLISIICKLWIDVFLEQSEDGLLKAEINFVNLFNKCDWFDE